MIETSTTTRRFDDVFPFAGIFDEGICVHRRGPFTCAWEVTLPRAYSLSEDEYDSIIIALSAAAMSLPSWSVLHKQDIYLLKKYDSEAEKRPGGFLEASEREHFSGRPYLEHKCYIYLTLARKTLVRKRSSDSGLAIGFESSIVVPDGAAFRFFLSKCKEFETTAQRCPLLKLRRLSKEELVGHPSGQDGGLVQEIIQLGNRGPVLSDMLITPDSVEIGGKVMQSFFLGSADNVPSELSSVSASSKVVSVNGEDIFLSAGAAIGMNLDCEHIVNQYIIIPDQVEYKKELDKTRKSMVKGGSEKNENVANAEKIQLYLDDIDNNHLLTVYTHLNVLAWGPEQEYDDITAKLSAAIQTTGLTAVYGKYNTPYLYNASLPGNGFELGEENLMSMELMPALSMGIYETFTKSIEGGILRLCDRDRNIPVTLDFQAVARSRGYVDDFNVSIFGPTGTGKSFFDNKYVKDAYDAGEDVTIIDVGFSYKGLCMVINEETEGQDGVYMEWSRESPLSFNPFLGYREFLDENGFIREDNPDALFVFSLLQMIWSPRGTGWTTENKPILKQTVADFISWWMKGHDSVPVFDDYCSFLSDKVSKQLKSGKYKVKDIVVDEEDFDIKNFRLALSDYTSSGPYGVLLNSRNEIDLMEKRFVYFEVSKLADQDRTFYSLTVLNIIHQFDRKMRRKGGFKMLVIEEAWKAIANDALEPYLRELWKTSRKHSTSAVVITQELKDITSSAVIKDTILKNSSTRILLDQTKYRYDFDEIASLLSLSDKDVRQVFTINQGRNPKYNYREVFISLNGVFSGVYATEVSPEEALVFESSIEGKKRLMELAEEKGSIIDAVKELCPKTKPS